MKLSVIVPTKNEAENIGACLDAFAAFRDEIELIVVDNSSPDSTREIAASKGAKVFVQGPERCAQRNRGAREASGEYVMFVDADMIVPEATVCEILAFAGDALYVPEIRVGRGLRIKSRNFERSFYNATCIDGLRVFLRSLFNRIGGYDESLVACEDWDLDRRIVAAGGWAEIASGPLFHNEARQDIRKFLAKKAYYSKSVDAYRRKWKNDGICRRQFGFGYRYFGVFVEHGKWKRLLRHPILSFVMYLERIAVGFIYLRQLQNLRSHMGGPRSVAAADGTEPVPPEVLQLPHLIRR